MAHAGRSAGIYAVSFPSLDRRPLSDVWFNADGYRIGPIPVFAGVFAQSARPAGHPSGRRLDRVTDCGGTVSVDIHVPASAADRLDPRCHAVPCQLGLPDLARTRLSRETASAVRPAAREDGSRPRFAPRQHDAAVHRKSRSACDRHAGNVAAGNRLMARD